MCHSVCSLQEHWTAQTFLCDSKQLVLKPAQFWPTLSHTKIQKKFWQSKCWLESSLTAFNEHSHSRVKRKKKPAQVFCLHNGNTIFFKMAAQLQRISNLLELQIWIKREPLYFQWRLTNEAAYRLGSNSHRTHIADSHPKHFILLASCVRTLPFTAMCSIHTGRREPRNRQHEIHCCECDCSHSIQATSTSKNLRGNACFAFACCEMLCVPCKRVLLTWELMRCSCSFSMSILSASIMLGMALISPSTLEVTVPSCSRISLERLFFSVKLERVCKIQSNKQLFWSWSVPTCMLTTRSKTSWKFSSQMYIHQWI